MKGKLYKAPFLGSFFLKDDKVRFMPSLEFIESSNLNFVADETNIHPFRTQPSLPQISMSASAIAAVCECKRQDVLAIIKEVFLRVIEEDKFDLKIDL